MNANSITREQIIANILAAVATRNVTATHNGKTGWEERLLLLGQQISIDIARKRTPGSSMWKPEYSGGWYVDVGGNSKGRFHWSAKRDTGLDYIAIADELIYEAERQTRASAESAVRFANIDAVRARFPQERSFSMKLPHGTTIEAQTRTGRFEIVNRIRVNNLTLDQAAALDEALGALLAQYADKENVA